MVIINTTIIRSINIITSMIVSLLSSLLFVSSLSLLLLLVVDVVFSSHPSSEPGLATRGLPLHALPRGRIAHFQLLGRRLVLLLVVLFILSS